MIKDAIKYVVDLGKVQLHEIKGQTYSSQSLSHIRQPQADAISVNTLSGLTEYILSQFDEIAHAGKLVRVVSFDKVELVSNILSDRGRETYMIAQAMKPRFDFGTWHDVESFVIAMQSCFVRNADLEIVLKVAGTVQDEAVTQYGDDGVSQQVTAKAGIATYGKVRVPNPVTLAPFRTFIELEQPESKFVFRMKQGNRGPECALFEADGGAWKLDAMDKIKKYLEGYLKDTSIKVIS